MGKNSVSMWRSMKNNNIRIECVKAAKIKDLRLKATGIR